jgi:5'-phosphate synthase pdxT subunit
MKIYVGVLAIQGGYQSHIDMLKKIGVKSCEIRTTDDLESVTHLIIPGGETTTIQKVIRNNGIWNHLTGFKGPVMGTCMGSILMASEIQEPKAEGFSMLDIAVKRNAYGRQINSFIAEGKTEFSEKPFEMVFIRAPKIVRIGENIRPIAWLDDEVTGVMAGNKIAVTFHPELSNDMSIHKFFVSLPAE